VLWREARLVRDQDGVYAMEFALAPSVG